MMKRAARGVELFLARVDASASPDELVWARAPGRVNLIGEHTDYNDGFVFPMAIDREVVLVARPRSDRLVRLYSADFDQRSEFSLDAIARDDKARWSNYFRGVVHVLQQAGHRLGGMDALVMGDVPQGAGLSSSAAFEVASTALLDALFRLGIDPAQRALYSQRAENEFVGVQCGIMDQFASSVGQADHALFLDCRSLEHENVPFQLTDAEVVVINTNKRRGLVDSEYNARRNECEQGAAFFAEKLPGVQALRDVTPEQFEAYAEALPIVARKRCRHVISECDRTLKSVDALKRGDLAAFGRLMSESHQSLRDDFEVSCFELDALVDIAHDVPGVYGARMTGAGFGGCVVVLVRQDSVASLAENVREAYPRKTGLTPDVFQFRPWQGATAGSGGELTLAGEVG